MVFVDDAWFKKYILNDLCICGVSEAAPCHDDDPCIKDALKRLERMFTEQCGTTTVSKEYFNYHITAIFDRDSEEYPVINAVFALDDALVTAIERENNVDARIALLTGRSGALRAFLFWKKKTDDNGLDPVDLAVPEEDRRHAELILVCAKKRQKNKDGSKPPGLGRPTINEFIRQVTALGFTDIFLDRVERNRKLTKLKLYYEQFGFKTVGPNESNTIMRLRLPVPVPPAPAPTSNKRPRDEVFEEDEEYEEKLPRLANAPSAGAGAGAASPPPTSPKRQQMHAKPNASSPSPPPLPPPPKRRLPLEIVLTDEDDDDEDGDELPPPNLLVHAKPIAAPQAPPRRQQEVISIDDESDDDDEVEFLHTTTHARAAAAPNFEAELEATHVVEDYARENNLTLEEAAEQLGFLTGGANNKYYLLGRSWRRGKRYVVVAHNPHTKTSGPPIHFGDVHLPNFTQHHNLRLRDEHLQRQARRGGGPTTPQFWDRWILWNKPTKRESIRALERALHAKIRPFK